MIIESCMMSDDSTFAYAVGQESCECEVFVRDRPVSIITPFDDCQVIEGEEAIFKAKLRKYLIIFI